MRKLILALIAAAFSFAVNAQFSVAIVAGPQINTVSPNYSLLPDTASAYTITKHTGLNFGFIANSPLNKKQTVFLRTGALYSAKGSQTFQSFDTANVNLADGDLHILEATTNLKVNYIDIPLNLLFKLPLKGKTKFLFGAGGQASLFYNGSTDFTTVSIDTSTKQFYKQVINKDLPVGTADNKYRTIHFSANALTGFEFGRVFLTVGYSHGLTDFLKSGDQSFKHKTLTFNLGIFLGNSSQKTIVVKDRDKDGVPDDEDVCPELPGTALTKGCPDKDGDGIADREDKCPTVPGTLKNKGCPLDTDGDGIKDEDDKCPDQPGTAQNKGCPLFDKDKDGVLDADDKCPDVPGTKKYNGCPVPDTDHDGVNDDDDQCPTVAGEKSNHGCPKITKEEQQKVQYAAKRIQFEFKSTEVSPSSFALLDEVVNILKGNPTLNIRIEGHTSGPVKESNTILSQTRADSVKEYFVNKGIASSRILSVGMGSAKHISKDGDTKENPEDRRVELIIF